MSNYTVHVGPDKRLELSRGLSGLHWVVNIVPKLRVWNREAAAVLLENPMANLRNWGGGTASPTIQSHHVLAPP